MNNKRTNLGEAIARAEAGCYREYWLQLYIKNNYKKLGFDSLVGPFEVGPDFKGVYKGEKVAVEAERLPAEFVKHGHNPKEIGILIVFGGDDTDRRLLPKKIIKVDAEDFIKETHEMRKSYAIIKQKERETFPFRRIKGAFATLWSLFVEERPCEGTPEEEVFEKALDVTAFKYLKAYDIDFEKLRKKHARIETLANILVKSRSEFDDLTDEEQAFLENWIEILYEEYADRI